MRRTTFALAAAVALAAAAVAAPAGAATLLTALSLAFWNPLLSPARPRAESVVFTQTSPELMPVVKAVLAHARTREDPAAAVFGEATWPLSWYFRRLPVYWAMPNPGSRPPFLIVDDTKVEEARRIVGGDYVVRQIPLRVWWVPEVSLSPLQPTPRQLLVYLTTRRPWNPVGSQNVVVLTRPDVARSPAR